MAMIGQRQPRQHDRAYMAWISSLPCVACYRLRGTYKGGVHVAHVRMAIANEGWRETGMQQKPDDRRTVPLCPGHHLDGPQAQHRIGERAFWILLGINPARLCAALSFAYDNSRFGEAVIAIAAGEGRRQPWTGE